MCSVKPHACVHSCTSSTHLRCLSSYPRWLTWQSVGICWLVAELYRGWLSRKSPWTCNHSLGMHEIEFWTISLLKTGRSGDISSWHPALLYRNAHSYCSSSRRDDIWLSRILLRYGRRRTISGRTRAIGPIEWQCHVINNFGPDILSDSSIEQSKRLSNSIKANSWKLGLSKQRFVYAKDIKGISSWSLPRLGVRKDLVTCWPYLFRP